MEILGAIALAIVVTIGGKLVDNGINFVKSESVGQYKHLDKSLFQFIDVINSQ